MQSVSFKKLSETTKNAQCRRIAGKRGEKGPIHVPTKRKPWTELLCWKKDAGAVEGRYDPFHLIKNEALGRGGGEAQGSSRKKRNIEKGDKDSRGKNWSQKGKLALPPELPPSEKTLRRALRGKKIGGERPAKRKNPVVRDSSPGRSAVSGQKCSCEC